MNRWNKSEYHREEEIVERHQKFLMNHDTALQSFFAVAEAEEDGKPLTFHATAPYLYVTTGPWFYKFGVPGRDLL